MSNLLLPVRATDVPTATPAPNDARLGVTDRLALRLGLWLLLRSAARLERTVDHTAHARTRRNSLAHEQRTLHAQRQYLLAPRV